MPIHPAEPHFTPSGVPYSPDFDDVYHSADGGLGQARHVFLAGNRLPERWQGREHFVILETGFGLGLNLLATWAAWRADAQHCERLHFVSCELQPFRREHLAALHAPFVAQAPELGPLAEELHAAWPTLTPGLHRIPLEQGRVILSLYLGEATEGLARLGVQADAFYLDGFSPAKNPQLWSARIFHQLARLSAPDATLATWSVAGDVREGLRRAGFETHKAPGFGGKRQMLLGHLHPRAVRSPAMRPAARSVSPDGADTQRNVLVIGAGLAGSTVAERLAARGWQVTVIDAADHAAAGASGNHAGVLRPLPSLDDNRLGRLTRAGTLYALRHFAQLHARGQSVRFDPCGVLHLARDAAQADKQQAVVERLRPPAEHLQFVNAQQASTLAGWPLEQGGWWFPEGGWVQPHSLCRANLAAHPHHIRCLFGQTVAGLQHDGQHWHAVDHAGRSLAHAPHILIANGVGIRTLPHTAHLPVVSARGQVSLLPAEAGTAPQVVVCRGGYVSPAVDGLRCAGATFSVHDDDPTLRSADHAENLHKLDTILPGYLGTSNPPLAGRVGFRPASPDRLPLAGALPMPLPGTSGTSGTGRKTSDIARYPGLWVISGFGARGLVFAPLVAEALASQLCGEPLPLESDLWEALDPARFLLRANSARARPED